MLFKRHQRNDLILGILFLLAGPVLTIYSLREGNAWGAWMGGVFIASGIGGIDSWWRGQKMTQLEEANAKLRGQAGLPPAA